MRGERRKYENQWEFIKKRMKRWHTFDSLGLGGACTVLQ